MKCPTSIAEGAGWAPCWMQSLLVWASAHQVILASLIALASAAATIFHIRKQISQTNKLYEKGLELDKKTHLTSASILMFQILDIPFRAKRHLTDIHEKFGDVGNAELATLLSEIVGDQTVPRELSPNEVHALVTIKKGMLIASISEIRSAIIMERVLISKIGVITKQLENEIKNHRTFREVNGHLEASIEFNRVEQPELHAQFWRLGNAADLYVEHVRTTSDKSHEVMKGLRKFLSEQQIGIKLEMPEDVEKGSAAE